MQEAIIVTGAASGIGLTTVKKYLTQGKIVVALDRNTSNLSKLTAQYSNKLYLIQLDLSQEEELKDIDGLPDEPEATNSKFLNLTPLPLVELLDIRITTCDERVPVKFIGPPVIYEEPEGVAVVFDCVKLSPLSYEISINAGFADPLLNVATSIRNSAAE